MNENLTIDPELLRREATVDVDKLAYQVVRDNEDKRLTVHIGNGYFKNFFFKINHLRLTYLTDDDMIMPVTSYDEVDDKDVTLDFEYDLTLVPPDYVNQDGDQEEFENVVRNVVIDVLMNRQELYTMENNEHQTNSESTDQE